jgi:predicted amidophosphoribosyltransferase
MLQRTQGRSTGIHLPLRNLALCLDCDECFALGGELCPACGSRTWTPAARFLDLVAPGSHRRNGSTRKMAARQAAEEVAIVKQLLIVARNRRQLYEEIKRAFAGQENVDVILDRRVLERRRSKEAPGVDRRSRSRRFRPAIDEQLRTIGWSLVLLDLAKQKRS